MSNSRDAMMGSSRDAGDLWYHGRITRENAAHLVSSHPSKLNGYFLVRESLRMPGSYVLTMWADNTVHHFQIIGHGDSWFSVDNGPLFQGIDELINHYRNKPDGLPQRLLDFVQGQPPPLSARKRVLTNLHKAVAQNDLKTVSKYLSGPTSLSVGTVDSPNAEGQTPVHEAAKRGFFEVVKILMEYKPDLSLRDSKGSTALHLAARNGHHDIIKLLVEVGGADVQERNTTTGWVALHEAAFRGNVECCKVLLSFNAPLRPRTPAPDEDTPRELAYRYKQEKVVQLLDWVAQNYPKPRTNTSEWLHKVLDRNRAVELLRDNGQVDGSFLVRPNSRKPGYYALTLVCKQMPYHYEIICEV
jgi:tyrosine-protein kinase